MLVCFSHLRWEFVWQRPQHLLSRFARRMPVYVVEEPAFAAAAPPLRVRSANGVTILTPVLPPELGSPGFGLGVNAAIGAALAPFFAALPARQLAAEVVFWYYTPMALGAEPAGLTPDLVVFDAMDELANFRFAPEDLVEREAALMARADLVFAGGPSLYRARRERHPAVHCFPSGVEAAHFAQAANGALRHLELAARRRPILGYYGVIDERIDLDLLAAVAAARPDWTLALIGPLAKIEPEDLPRRDNIIAFGLQPYDELPSFLACFDVALMPFARNAATRFISPTKTLEYLAGGKPVVSTPIDDVVDLYGAVVRFGDTPAAFIGAIEAALAEAPQERMARREAARALLARHDWDAIADEMHALVRRALLGRQPEPLLAADDPLYATGVA